MSAVKLTRATLWLVCLGFAITGTMLAGAGPSSSATEAPPAAKSGQFSGSASCRACHKKFYGLWASSYHGRAMQPFTAELARTQLKPQSDDITVGEHHYRATIDGGTGSVRDRWPGGERTYRIDYAVGGKNFYYFLTPMERGRLQVLPVAFDVRKNEWFDTAASAVRHAFDRTDEPLDWLEWPYTFNTACHSCHVSQLSRNYDLATDSYHTVWREPGINCETCHGPGGEHVRVCEDAPPGQTPKDLKIILTKKFTTAQMNALCASCHAKMVPLTAAFQPGDRFFDHFDLLALEDPDFYPDARDLGENYTHTLWLTSPCLLSGRFDCRHCHTPSGRYRFASERPDDACMPCHDRHVADPAAHSHHRGDSPGSRCVSCHMPKTWFGRMQRHDHSMRPPAPAATIAFHSPNACNICHTDQDAAWADHWVRQWRQRDYQAPVLHRARLIEAARKQDWSQLPAILSYLVDEDRDAVYAASLIRLLRECDAEEKWPVLITTLRDRSPLVRAAAADALADHFTPEAIKALLGATRDEYRLVRIRAAGALASLPRKSVTDEEARTHLDRATAEFEAAMQSRPDDPVMHFNLGTFYMQRQEFRRAVASFETAVRLRTQNLPPLVNASLAYYHLGEPTQAEESLRKALAIDATNAAANLNLGLLLGELGRMREAEAALRTALKTDPTSAVAAYNLSVLVAKDRLDEAIQWARRAAELRPDEPRYAGALALYEWQNGNADRAIDLLRELIRQQPTYADAYLSLGAMYERLERFDAARSLYQDALAIAELPAPARQHMAARLKVIESR